MKNNPLRKRSTQKLLCGLVCSLVCASLEAAPFFGISSSLPATGSSSSTINYSITNLTNVTITGLKLSPADMTRLTTTTCGTSLAAGATCSATVLLTAPSGSGQITIQSLSVCGFNGLACNVAPAANLISMTVSGGQITSASGGGGTSPVPPSPPSPPSPPPPPTGFAYVANSNNNSISLCTVNTATGAFSGCTTAVTLSNATQFVVTNAAGTRLWVSLANAVNTCAITPSTGALTGCTSAGLTGGLITQGVAISESLAKFYTVNGGGNSVAICTVDLSTGLFSGCGNSTGTGLSAPVGIALNTASTLAFVTNVGSNLVMNATLNGSGNFATQNTTGSTMNSPSGIALNSAGTRAFVSNSGINSVSVCTVSTINGTFSACATSGTVSDGRDIKLNTAGTRAFISSQSSNMIISCSVDTTTGVLSGCTDTGGTGFVAPLGIALVGV